MVFNSYTMTDEQVSTASTHVSEMCGTDDATSFLIASTVRLPRSTQRFVWQVRRTARTPRLTMTPFSAS